MAIYNRLSVGAGGGVINNFQKSERQPDATICIGLGGTGSDAIKKLKREVYKRLKPDDENSPIPAYKNIKYLLIDSDDSKIGAQDDLGEIQKQTEYFDISNGDIKTAMAAKEILKNRAEMNWLNYENISIKDAGNGAGGIRQVGRYLLIDKAAALKAKLTAIINEAMLGVTGDINVHIFSGLSGGTGSGTFIDVCYIVQNVLESLGRVGGSRVCGYFFLPDVNLSKPEIVADPLVSNYIRVNGYAALKELDYLMNLEADKGHFRQNYGTFSVDTVKPPVDLCYLISSTTANGVSVEDGYNYGLSVAADYVITFLSKVTLPAGVAAGAADGGQTLQGHIANLEQAKNSIKKLHGALIDYNIIGAANAEMPLSDIATYLGAKLFERFDFMYNQVPAENQLMEFVTKNQLGYEQILGALTKGIAFHVPFPKYDPKDLIASNKQPIDRCDDWIAGARGKLQENRKNMEEKLRDYKIPENSTSLIARIYLDLYTNYACDAKYGPFFAMRMLGGMNNKNMRHVIDGYVQKNDSLMAAEVRQDKLREDDLKNAEAQLKNAHTGLFGNAEKRSQEYLGTLNNWYVHLANIEKYKYMQSLLRTLREQVVELNNNFFDVLTTVLDTIKNTFEDNARILTAGVRPTANTYTWKILDIPDIQGQLDTAVSSLDVNQVMKNFVTDMFMHYPEWLTQDTNKIAILISEFITAQFSAITQQTIKDFLQIKYATTDPVILQRKIKEDIIQNRLDTKADPLFWKNSLFSLDQIAKNCTISVPYNTPEIVQAAEDFGVGGGISVRKTGLTDRIFMMRFYTGVPLYAYQGLPELEKAYEVSKAPGIHLYEAGDVDWRQTLPSPIPASFKIPGHDIKRIADRNQKLSEELETAKKTGIIYYDGLNWQLKMTGKLELDAITGDYKEGGKADPVKLAEAIDKVRSYKEHMFDQDNIQGQAVIDIKGALEGQEENVLRDNFLRFPDMIALTEEELKKAEAIEKKLEEMEGEMTSGGEERKMKEAFFNALFTGVFEMGLTKIIYRYEEFGMEETLDLQNNKMPYGKCAVYQAYITFSQDINEEMREQIIERATDKLDNLEESDLEVAQKIKKKYTSDFLKTVLMNVAADPKREEIKAFYQEFMQMLQNYLRQYTM